MAQRVKIAGRSISLPYELVGLAADRLVFVGTNKNAKSTDTTTVVPDGAGSQITYLAVIEVHGLARLAVPLTKFLFEKIGNDTVKEMTTVLESLGPA